MDYLEIEGGHKLSGEITISGAKNAALPIIAATILSDKKVKVEHNDTEATIDCSSITSTKAVYEIVSQMRASILVLGPLLSRFKYCEVSLPGGCAIGQRPIDLHIKAAEALGATITLKQGYVVEVEQKML